MNQLPTHLLCILCVCCQQQLLVPPGLTEQLQLCQQYLCSIQVLHMPVQGVGQLLLAPVESFAEPLMAVAQRV